jgi:hypothetical protein
MSPEWIKEMIEFMHRFVLPVPSQIALTLPAVGGVAPLVDVLTEAPGRRSSRC